MSTSAPANPVLVEVHRGSAVESRHRGAIAAVDAAGNVQIALGAINDAIFPRSAVKPMQALPLVESGAADALGLDDADLALACGSHCGSARHTERVAAWLARLGVDETALRCGVHPPLDPDAARDLVRNGEQPGPLHHNCSGKHAGFLSLARHLGADLSAYLAPDGPVQDLVLDAIADMSGVGRATLDPATDGCSAPAVRLSLLALACAAARMADPRRLGARRAAAVQRLGRAMADHPWAVAGDGRLDCELAEATGGAVLSKAGAEGVIAGWAPGRGLGLALKIDDGAKRAADVALLGILDHLGLLDGAARAGLTPRMAPPVLSHQGAEVGQIRWRGMNMIE